MSMRTDSTHAALFLRAHGAARRRCWSSCWPCWHSSHDWPCNRRPCAVPSPLPVMTGHAAHLIGSTSGVSRVACSVECPTLPERPKPVPPATRHAAPLTRRVLPSRYTEHPSPPPLLRAAQLPSIGALLAHGKRRRCNCCCGMDCGQCRGGRGHRAAQPTECPGNHLPSV